ncbi:FliM/FliN family flagellar motor switch protein [Buchnera aphidicola]|uniref:FliM/FliN family flagellar motor switch protein n=1 Tax=Buchnera aphidicola TaxID=9 RepID=UPI00094C55DC|nr:FliM/FliN family flagellar motor switch protein [Buchnera aphidicola]
MKLINKPVKFQYQKNSISLEDQRVPSSNDNLQLKSFLFNRKIFFFDALFHQFSCMLYDGFKKNFSIKFNFQYLSFKYNNQYYAKKILSEQESNIFQLANLKEYCILMVSHNFFAIFTYILFGDSDLIAYKKNIYCTKKKNNIAIINHVLNNILIIFNDFLKKFFRISIQSVFKNKNSVKNFFKNNNLDDYIIFLFQVTFSSLKEVIKIYIPKSILYKIFLKNDEQNNLLKKNIKTIWNKKIECNIKSINLFLKINIMSYFISLNDFFDLRIGDIFCIKKIKYVLGFFDNFPLILGRYGIYHGYRSLYFKNFINAENKCMINKKFIISSKDSASNNDIKIHQDFSDNKIYKQKILKKEETGDTISSKKNDFLDFLKKMKPFMNIPVAITIELGTKKLSLKKLLNLSEGSILQLNEKENVPLKIYIQDYLLALGELVIVNEKYGVRIINLMQNLAI